MGLLESLPVQRIRPVAIWPFWLGSLRDHSGNGNHGTATNMNWRRCAGQDGVFPTTSSSRVDINYDPSIAVTDMTIFAVSMSGFRQESAQQLLVNRGGAAYQLVLRSDRLRLRAGLANSDRVTTYRGAQSICVALVSGVGSEFYVDGSSVGTGGAVTPDTNADALDIVGATATAPISECQLMAMYGEPLSSTEVSDLHNWAVSRFTPSKQWPGGGLSFPGGLSTGDPVFVDSIQTARVTLADETSGLLSNTEFSINSGTWAIAEDADGKYVSCVANGQLEYGLIGASGYTTDLFDADGAALTKNANNIQIDATAGDIIRAVRLVA